MVATSVPPRPAAPLPPPPGAGISGAGISGAGGPAATGAAGFVALFTPKLMTILREGYGTPI